MRKLSNASQRCVDNIRKRLRDDMQRLALTHRGCAVARGCGCLVDKTLDVLGAAEQKLFYYELNSYANPSTPRRIVEADNTVSIAIDPPLPAPPPEEP